MPLVSPEPPPEVLEAFSAGVRAFVRESTGEKVSKEAFAGEPPVIPTLADLGEGPYQAAQQTFLLALNDAADGAGGEKARPVGWRFFAGRSEDTALLGWVTRRGPQEPWRMTSASYGPRVWAALQEARALQDLPRIRGAEYQLRVLTVPGLHLEGFWMVAQAQGDPDLVAPFPASPNQTLRELNDQPVYTMPQFVETIAPIARQELHGGGSSSV
jgi:hypothetical protein